MLRTMTSRGTMDTFSKTPLSFLPEYHTLFQCDLSIMKKKLLEIVLDSCLLTAVSVV